MSAAELRQAAETLRGLANAATPGPWRHTDSEVVDDVWEAGLVVVDPERNPLALVADQWYEDEDGEPTPWHDATYITTLHPGVGLALVDILDFAAETARGWESIGSNDPAAWPEPTRLANALARLINGSAS